MPASCCNIVHRPILFLGKQTTESAATLLRTSNWLQRLVAVPCGGLVLHINKIYQVRQAEVIWMQITWHLACSSLMVEHTGENQVPAKSMSDYCQNHTLCSERNMQNFEHLFPSKQTRICVRFVCRLVTAEILLTIQIKKSKNMNFAINKTYLPQPQMDKLLIACAL